MALVGKTGSIPVAKHPAQNDLPDGTRNVLCTVLADIQWTLDSSVRMHNGSRARFDSLSIQYGCCKLHLNSRGRVRREYGSIPYDLLTERLTTTV